MTPIKIHKSAATHPCHTATFAETRTGRRLACTSCSERRTENVLSLLAKQTNKQILWENITKKTAVKIVYRKRCQWATRSVHLCNCRRGLHTAEWLDSMARRQVHLTMCLSFDEMMRQQCYRLLRSFRDRMMVLNETSQDRRQALDFIDVYLCLCVCVCVCLWLYLLLIIIFKSGNKA